MFTIFFFAFIILLSSSLAVHFLDLDDLTGKSDIPTCIKLQCYMDSTFAKYNQCDGPYENRH